MTAPSLIGDVFFAIRERIDNPWAASPVGYDELRAFLDAELPRLRAAVQAFEGGFSWAKAKTLAETVSRAVKEGLPLVKGEDAAVVAEGIIAYLWTSAVVPLLPAYVRPFQGLLLTLLLGALEGIYRSRVKHS